MRLYCQACNYRVPSLNRASLWGDLSEEHNRIVDGKSIKCIGTNTPRVNRNGST